VRIKTSTFKKRITQCTIGTQGSGESAHEVEDRRPRDTQRTQTKNNGEIESTNHLEISGRPGSDSSQNKNPLKDEKGWRKKLGGDSDPAARKKPLVSVRRQSERSTSSSRTKVGRAILQDRSTCTGRTKNSNESVRACAPTLGGNSRADQGESPRHVWGKGKTPRTMRMQEELQQDVRLLNPGKKAKNRKPSLGKQRATSVDHLGMRLASRAKRGGIEAVRTEKWLQQVGCTEKCVETPRAYRSKSLDFTHAKTELGSQT